MSLIIVGAGMAGLLAANMLRHRDPVVMEGQFDLPHNHSAVLRFSSSLVSDVLGIKFRKVNLVKAVLPWRNPVADALAYSEKCLGVYRSDRSPVLPRPETSVRYIAPPDLIEQMASRVEVSLGCRWSFPLGGPKVISTIPMPALMEALDYPWRSRVKFRYSFGTNVRAMVLKSDAYVSLLVPDPELAFSRVSLTGEDLVVEFPSSGPNDRPLDEWAKLVAQAAALIGVRSSDIGDGIEIARQAYHKIAPIDDVDRVTFIHWASTMEGRAWQLGRFATWRPGLLLDDLVNDVRLIDGWMNYPVPEAQAERHDMKRRAS